ADAAAGAVIPTVDLLGLAFAALDVETAAAWLARRSPAAPFGYVTTVNADHLVRLKRRPELVPIYREALMQLLDSRVVARAARFATAGETGRGDRDDRASHRRWPVHRSQPGFPRRRRTACAALDAARRARVAASADPESATVGATLSVGLSLCRADAAARTPG